MSRSALLHHVLFDLLEGVSPFEGKFDVLPDFLGDFESLNLFALNDVQEVVLGQVFYYFCNCPVPFLLLLEKLVV